MEILDPKSAIQKEMEALNNVATAPEEPSEPFAIPSDPEDLDRENGLGVDDDDVIEEDEPLDDEGLAKEDTDFSIKEEDEK